MKATKKEVKKSEKSGRVLLEVPIPKRALGVRLPVGNPTIVLAKKVDVSAIPNYLRPVWEKVERAGKDGIKIDTLAHPGTGEGRVARWHVRTLMNEKCGGFLKAIPEPKSEKPKNITIANAVKDKLQRKTAHKSSAARKAA